MTQKENKKLLYFAKILGKAAGATFKKMVLKETRKNGVINLELEKKLLKSPKFYIQ